MDYAAATATEELDGAGPKIGSSLGLVDILIDGGMIRPGLTLSCDIPAQHSQAIPTPPRRSLNLNSRSPVQATLDANNSTANLSRTPLRRQSACLAPHEWGCSIERRRWHVTMDSARCTTRSLSRCREYGSKISNSFAVGTPSPSRKRHSIHTLRCSSKRPPGRRLWFDCAGEHPQGTCKPIVRRQRLLRPRRH